MKMVTIYLLLVLCAGCRTQVADVSGHWYLAGYGYPVILEQNGHEIAGTITGTKGPDGPRDLAVVGKVKGGTILLTLEPHGTLSMPLRYEWSTSPKGDKQFLKCRDNSPYSLIPEGLMYFKYDILKKEFDELRKKQDSSQQDAGAYSPKAADGLRGNAQR